MRQGKGQRLQYSFLIFCFSFSPFSHRNLYTHPLLPHSYWEVQLGWLDYLGNGRKKRKSKRVTGIIMVGFRGEIDVRVGRKEEAEAADLYIHYRPLLK